MKEFFEKNKVFLSGLLGAIVLTIAQIDLSNGTDLKVFIMPVIIAVSGYFANNLRGQWASVVGIIFAVIIGYAQARLTGESFQFDAKTIQLIALQVAVLFFGFVAPPPKDQGYEKAATIQKAKREGEVIQERIEETKPPQL